MAARTQSLVDPRPTASEPTRSVEENRFSLRLEGFAAESKSRERTKSVRVTPSSLAHVSHSAISSGARRTVSIFVILSMYYKQIGPLSIIGASGAAAPGGGTSPQVPDFRRGSALPIDLRTPRRCVPTELERRATGTNGAAAPGGGISPRCPTFGATAPF